MERHAACSCHSHGETCISSKIAARAGPQNSEQYPAGSYTSSAACFHSCFLAVVQLMPDVSRRFERDATVQVQQQNMEPYLLVEHLNLRPTWKSGAAVLCGRPTWTSCSECFTDVTTATPCFRERFEQVAHRLLAKTGYNNLRVVWHGMR